MRRKVNFQPKRTIRALLCTSKIKTAPRGAVSLYNNMLFNFFVVKTPFE